MKDSADQFFSAFELLDCQPPGSGVLLPLINTAMIATELYLKSLSSEFVFTPTLDMNEVYEVNPKPLQHGHNLRNIFNKVPPDYQAQMKSLYPTDQLPLDDLLVPIEGAFMESRYSYENSSDVSRFSLRDIRKICRFLNSYIANLEPSEFIEW